MVGRGYLLCNSPIEMDLGVWIRLSTLDKCRQVETQKNIVFGDSLVIVSPEYTGQWNTRHKWYKNLIEKHKKYGKNV
jgi:hypothetical protein